MRIHDVIAYEKARLCSLWVWMPVVVFGTILTLVNVGDLALVPGGLHPIDFLSAVLFSFGLTSLILWLSPAPWLLTRGRATHAPFIKGLLQSGGFAAAYILLLAGILVLLNAGEKTPTSKPRALLALGSALAVWVPATMLVGYFITLWERTRMLQEETEKKLREAHWVLLRGQLSPHALFNALNALVP